MLTIIGLFPSLLEYSLRSPSPLQKITKFTTAAAIQTHLVSSIFFLFWVRPLSSVDLLLLQVVSGQPQTLLHIICPALGSENQPFLRVRMEKTVTALVKEKERKKETEKGKEGKGKEKERRYFFFLFVPFLF